MNRRAQRHGDEALALGARDEHHPGPQERSQNRRHRRLRVRAAKNDTGPAGDQTVSFTVTGANQKSEALTTNTNGEVAFCYKGTKGGLDTITAFVDSNENKTKDESEPQDTATKRWLSNQPSIALRTKDRRKPARHHPHADRDRHRRRHPGRGRAGRLLQHLNINLRLPGGVRSTAS